MPDTAWGEPTASEPDRPAASIQSALKHALHRIRCGVIVTSVARRPVFINAHAQCILSRKDALMIVDGVLNARMAEDTRLLQRALDGAASGAPDAVTVPIRGEDSARRISVHVVGVPPRTPDDARDALLFVCDPAVTLEASQPALRTLFGLTRAEAVLADLMIQGCSLESAADRLCVSIHTARTHLKRILLKTDTGRQGELLRLMFVCAGVVALD
jgi:DNA-binding CsgD family transcriptional regulator